jgi:hypothetical protein
MREIPAEKVWLYGILILVVASSASLLSIVPRTRGRKILWHVIFAVAGICSVLFLPDWIQTEVFSPGGVLVVGTFLPIYKSIVAVCTPGKEDDTIWLQFWIASGALSYSTEFVDEIRHYFPQGGEHWYEFEFLVTLWMLVPLTDGATLIYDLFTEPVLTPLCIRISHYCQGWIQFLLLTAINSSYIWWTWFIFVSMPEESRRFAVVAVGTIYPLAASTVAIATQNKDNTTTETRMNPKESTNITFWLTYWSCWSVLFVLMDYAENFIGHIRGFYSLILVATVYLFLPMLQGAETIFRNILVPLSGQYENLVLLDAYKMRQQIESSIPERHRTAVLQKVAEVFAETKKKAS